MVDRIEATISATRRRLSLSYHVALTLVALVVIMIAVICGHLVKAQIDDTAIINLSGKQRMWSQRIALLTRDLVDSSEANRVATLQLLREAVTNMEQAHESLTQNAMEEATSSATLHSLKEMYFSPPLNLEAEVRAYLGHAHAVLTLPVSKVSYAQGDVTALLMDAHGQLLDSLDAAVTIYQKETVERFTTLRHIVIGLSGLALAMLTVIALLIFRPALAYVAQAQKRLVELNQLKGDFLANMSHEIRTPMNGIFGMTELLIDSELNQRQQHYVRTLQNSADHLLGLINDILDFSKLEAGQMKIDPIRFNLLATIEDVLDLLSSRAREKNLELLLRYAPGTPRFVVADPGRIRQILFNLIGNAIKFTDKGYVMVHVDIARGEAASDKCLSLRVRIEDTGIGIPEDKIASLFEKFMQVETGSTRARQGTGLGLAICRNLLRLMGGDIRVESRPGSGTVFAWHIPLPEADEPEAAVNRHKQLEGKRLLLVDDLAPNRLLYKETLSAAGIECLVAENAQEALSILAYEQDSGRELHMVITDYMMPVVNGMQFTRTLKNAARFADLPVIILTSAGEQGLIKQFDAAGASAALAKPVARQQLLDTLTHVFDAQAQGVKQSIITAEASTSMSARLLFTRDQPLYGIRILVVEDNRINQEIVTEMLHQLGCEVDTAENGSQALDMVRQHSFDLIFMDCQMPDMDGFEAARHITTLKAEKKIGPVPIIALTANALKGDRERCLESGMDDYLSKPMRKANLEAILLKWLREKLEMKKDPPPVTRTLELVKSEPRPAASGSPSDYGIDASAFQAAQELLGSKLPTILSYYLEDAEGYINRIADSLARHDMNGAVTPAHTLKSSSRQLGVTELAELAARAEATARLQGKSEMDVLAALLPDMRTVLSRVRPFFQSAIG